MQKEKEKKGGGTKKTKGTMEHSYIYELLLLNYELKEEKERRGDTAQQIMLVAAQAYSSIAMTMLCLKRAYSSIGSYNCSYDYWP